MRVIFRGGELSYTIWGGGEWGMGGGGGGEEPHLNLHCFNLHSNISNFPAQSKATICPNFQTSHSLL